MSLIPLRQSVFSKLVIEKHFFRAWFADTIAKVTKSATRTCYESTQPFTTTSTELSQDAKIA